MKKIISNIITIILVFLILINVFSFFNISFLGYRTFYVATGSMSPSLEVNDLILIKKTNKLNVGDVITYEDGNSYVTHRIVLIEDNDIITKGDSNNTNDKPISKDKVVGKMVYKFKLLYLAGYLFKNPVNWVVIFIVGLFVTILIPDKKQVKGTKNEEKVQTKEKI